MVEKPNNKVRYKTGINTSHSQEKVKINTTRFVAVLSLIISRNQNDIDETNKIKAM